MTARKIEIMVKLGIYSVITVVMFFGITGIGSCINEHTEQLRIENAKTAAYHARFPKTGDEVELNGTNVAIIKRYVWSSRFKVRYPDGTMADVADIEMLDKKPIAPDPNLPED